MRTVPQRPFECVEGTVLVGVDAFLAPWEAMPRYRRLRAVRLPGVFTGPLGL